MKNRMTRAKNKISGKYRKWVEWSEKDQTYIGKCPDLITGIHGDDPDKLYNELGQVVEDVISHFQSEGQPLPNPQIQGNKKAVVA